MTRDSSTETFSAEERAAMRDRAREVKAARRKGKDTAAEVVATIAEMPETDRDIARRLHDLFTSTAPGLTPRLWYGMPAYADNGKVVCFFQGAAKFKTRYSTLGFSDTATLDDKDSWPTAYAIARLTPDVETRLMGLVRRAVPQA